MTKAITRLEKAEKTAKIGKINANMVKVVFDNGRIETIPFTDAVLYAYGMMSLSDVLGDPAAVDADIIEVDLLDETDLHYSSVLMQAVGIDHFKVKGNKYETATAKIRNRI